MLDVEDRDHEDDVDDAEGVPPITRRSVGQAESARANRSWWDAEAAAYLEEHGSFLGPSPGAAGFVWGPEGLTEDEAGLLGEVARVLRPGGRFVFSLSHPLRWCLPDDPGPGGLVVRDSYFDRTPYVEQDPAGRATYVEHHRTLGDRVREVTAAGLRLVDLVEPEWPESNDQTWGGWSPLRGALVPGTAIFVCVRD